MKSSVHEDAKVSAASDANPGPAKVPRWLAAAGAGALALVPSLWLFFGRAAAGRGPSARPAATAPAEAEKKALLPNEYLQKMEDTRQLLATGKAQESLAVLDRCRELQPNGFAVHNNYCVAYGILERRDEAVLACQRALQIDPNNQLAMNNLVWVSGIKPKTAP